MQGSPKVIEMLNEALKHELAAVNQYWLHYRLLDDWGFTKLAAKERAESVEEMGHADTLIERIIMLDGHPNLQTVAPLMIGQNLREVLECDLKAEYGAQALYKKARAVCCDEDDFVSMELFADLLEDEEGHIDFIETQLDLIGSIGAENYGLLQSGAAE